MPSPAENITRHYNGDWHGSYGLIPTPGHSKTDRGTKIADGEGGDVLVHSYNGGDWKALKDEFRSRGFLPDREQPQGLRVIQSTEPRPASAHAVHLSPGQKIVATWEYRDGDRLLNRKHRIEPGRNGRRKDYAWDRPNGSSWVVGAGDERAPYRLNDLRSAPTDAVVLVVEGEKCADLANELGFVATSSKDWKPAFAEVIANRRVVILPDAGEAGAKIARAVQATIPNAQILDLPDLAEGEDIEQWAMRQDKGADAAYRLRELIEGISTSEDTFDLADLNAWAATAPTPKAFVMAPFIPRDDVVIITGDGGTNKSTLALQISACAAAGRQFLGLNVTPGPALYITAEDDQRENHWRLSKIATTIGTTLHALAGRLFVASLRGRLNNELATFEVDGKLRPSLAFSMLRQTIISTGAKLVTLDNVAHLYAGNENDRGQVTAFINLLYQLCGDLGVTVLLIAHRNKSGDSYSGSTAWLNAVRSQVLLERSNEHDPDERCMSLGKANYARAGETTTFRWHDFALIRNDDLPADQRSEIAANIMAASDNGIFLACLAERNEQRRQVSEKPTAANYAPKQFEGMPQAKGLSKKRLIDAMDRLYRAGAIERGLLYRDTAEGKDIHGLRETGKVPETSPETSRKQQPEGSGKPRKTTGNTPPILTYKGAAHEAAAPSQSTTILAPGETGDEPVPGWE